MCKVPEHSRAQNPAVNPLQKPSESAANASAVVREALQLQALQTRRYQEGSGLTQSTPSFNTEQGIKARKVSCVCRKIIYGNEDSPELL